MYKNVNRWMQGLEVFRAIEPTMPTQLVYTFLMVATHEGITATEIMQKSGFKLSTLSRHLLDLGRRNRMKQPGYELVEPRQDDTDIRRKLLYLTPKGRLIFQQLARITT